MDHAVPGRLCSRMIGRGMRAVTISPGSVRLEDLPAPGGALAPGEALVRVTGCGVCRTDVELAAGCALPPGVGYPLRPGHEVAGIVQAIGPAEDPSLSTGEGPLPEVGDVVVVHPILNCRACAACLGGNDNLCSRGQVLGLHRPGGMAEFLVWPLRRMVRTTLADSASAAILADAVATAHRAITQAGVTEGGTMVVLGAGGLGTQVLQLAPVLDPTIRLTSVVRSESTANRVAATGVRTLIGIDSAVRELRTINPNGADAVLDFTGEPTAPEQAMRMLRPGGRLVLGSVLDKGLSVNALRLLTRELELVGSSSSTLADLRAVVRLAEEGALDLRTSVSHRLSLDEAEEAIAMVERRDANIVRVVLTA
ncbi:zinc-dependent alcohol dehydrogenase [Amycolatopsis thermophila]|uniref:Propanol-preferring alcohol dehydrogenase n=1 Tax=Amycolatopsis thermophila TaxID=206084 RepID=A0ABU0F518_9PSEU|nr:alcohol dehydrogenase catalytic domain-containing protein [Amycolatopsis thermophila]MDQ0382680.1 propanol-preferring alcohol dehydrogenase [Amycolatopsis thermophila]